MEKILPESERVKENKRVFEFVGSNLDFQGLRAFNRINPDHDDYLFYEPTPDEVEREKRESFQLTRLDRGLFTPLDGDVYGTKKKHAPLANYLFKFEGKPSKRELFEKTKESLEGKRILLIGGGKMFGDLNSQGEIKPALILNVDPYVENKNTEQPHLADSDYAHSRLNMLNSSFLKELKGEGYQQFDEIIATFSLPHYIGGGVEGKKDLKNFFKNLSKVLAPGGTVRIHPIAFFDFIDFKGRDTDEMKENLVSCLKEMAEDPSIQFDIIEMKPKWESTLIIKKID